VNYYLINNIKILKRKKKIRKIYIIVKNKFKDYLTKILNKFIEKTLNKLV